MLGSNPSAAPGPKTEAECHLGTPFRAHRNFKDLGIGINAINPGGMGAGPHVYEVLSFIAFYPQILLKTHIFKNRKGVPTRTFWNDGRN